MRAQGAFPIAVSIGLILATTALLWLINSSAGGSHHLVYIYLFPVALIAAFYSGRLALLNTAIAMLCADYFLQKPLYVLGSDNPLEYGDLFVFALLAVTTIKFVRVLARSSVSSLAAKTLQPTQKPSLVSRLAAERHPGSSSK